MQILDIILLALLLLGALNGLRVGLIVELASIIGVVVGLILARVAYIPVQNVLASIVHHPSWLTPVSYVIAFVIFWWAITIVGRWVRRIAHRLWLGPLDRLGGLVFGLIQTAILLAVVLYLGERFHNPAIHHDIKHSVVATNLLRFVPTLPHVIPRIP